MKELKIAGYMAALIIVVLGLFWLPENKQQDDTVLVSEHVEKMASVDNIHIEAQDIPEDIAELYRTTSTSEDTTEETATNTKTTTEADKKVKIAPAQTEKDTEEPTTETLPEKEPLYEYEEHKSTAPEPIVKEETATEAAIEEEASDREESETADTSEAELQEADYQQEEAYEAAEPNMSYFCTSDLTAYVWTGNPCANGNYPTVGYTVACNGLPFGTKVYIEGVGYRVVEDRGDMKGLYDVDLFVGSYDEAINIGRQQVDVYIVE